MGWLRTGEPHDPLSRLAAASFRIRPGASRRWESTTELSAPWTGEGGAVTGPAQTTRQLPLPSTGKPRRCGRQLLANDGRP